MKKQTYIAPSAKMLGLFSDHIIAASPDLQLKPGESSGDDTEGGTIDSEDDLLSNKKQTPWGNNTTIWGK